MTWKWRAHVVQTNFNVETNIDTLGRRKGGKSGVGEMVGKKVRGKPNKIVTRRYKLQDEKSKEMENGSRVVGAVEQPCRLQ